MVAATVKTRPYLFDSLLELKDSYAQTSDAAWNVDAVAKIIPIGDARFDAMAVIDLTAIAIDGNDEVYNLIIQGSTASDFSSDVVNLAVLNLGATEVAAGGAEDAVIGAYELPFNNCYNGEYQNYIRGYTDGTGSSWSITFSCYIGRIPRLS